MQVGGKQPSNMQSILALMVTTLSAVWTLGVGLYICGAYLTLRVMLCASRPCLKGSGTNPNAQPVRIYGDGPALAKVLDRFGPGGACACLRSRLLALRVAGAPYWKGARSFLAMDSPSRTAEDPPPPLLKSAAFVEGMANFVVAEPRLARRQRLAASVGIHGICALAALPYARRLGLLTETRVDAMHCLAGVGKTVKLALEEMCASRQ